MKKYAGKRRFVRHALACVLASTAASLSFAAAAQTATVSSDDIASALSAGMNRALTRGIKPRANPDAATRICDPKLNDALLQQTGARGEELTRTIYVEAAPNLDLDIGFALGEATLLPEGTRQLDALGRALSDPRLAKQRFVVAGHTDAQGSVEYNDRLSCERALSARRYLQEKHGVDAARLIPMGFGFSRLKNPNNMLAAENRRVEVRKYVEGDH